MSELFAQIMTYLVKATITEEPRRYALVGIENDYRQKIISEGALARAEEQNFWYPVAELIGVAPTPELKYLCEHCKGWIKARKIDVGLRIKCVTCGKDSKIPDVQARQVALLDQHLLKEAASNIRFGLGLSCLGVGTTIASYYDAIEQSGPRYSIFWGLTVFGIGLVHHGWSQRRAFKKKYPGK